MWVRKALIRSLSRGLIIHKKIKTTEAKAKELRPIIEKIITKARINKSAENQRFVFRKIPDTKAVKKIFDEIAPQYKERKGGYTRIIKLPPRKNDKAKMAIIEFV